MKDTTRTLQLWVWSPVYGCRVCGLGFRIVLGEVSELQMDTRTHLRLRHDSTSIGLGQRVAAVWRLLSIETVS